MMRNIRSHKICGLAVLILTMLDSTVQGAETSLSELFNRVHASVVTVRALSGMLLAQDGIDLYSVATQGSGVLISEQGDILTASHLIQTAHRLQIEFADGTKTNATVQASEPAADIALLRLSEVPESAVVAVMGNSDDAQVGEQVFVIGAPYGLSHTLTVGYISARHRPGALRESLLLGELLQTDAAINQGNSGGPMFNMAGEIIGIVSYIRSKSGGFEGVGFAVTSNTVRELLLEARPLWSGITVFGLSGRLAKVFNLPQETGVLVQRIAQGSPASRMGLLPSFIPARIGEEELMVGGDIILSVDGITVGKPEDYITLRQHLSDVPDDHVISVQVWRHGKLVTLNFPLTR